MVAKNSAFCIRRRRDRGQAVVEYAIVFPIQLMLTFAIIQMAHLFVAKQVLEYGAYCAARAAMIGATDAEVKEAAVIPISAITSASNMDFIELPGWGTLPGSYEADDKTTVDISRAGRSGGNVIVCNIEHEYELDVPVGNFAVYELGHLFLGVDDLYYRDGKPHVLIKGGCTLPEP